MAFTGDSKKILISVNSEAFFWSHRLYLAQVCLKAGYEVIVVCPLENEFSKAKIEKLGFKVEPLAMKRHGLDIFGEFKIVRSFFQAFKKHQPDIFQGFTVKCNIYGSIVAGLTKTQQIYITMTGLGTPFTRNDLKSKLVRQVIIFLYKRIVPYKTKFIFQNTDDHSLFEQAGILNNRKVTLIPGTGVDTDKFSPAPQPPRVPRVLFPARVIKEKGICELIEACEDLYSKDIKFELWVCGSLDENSTGSLGAAYNQRIAKLPFVKYLGFQKDMHKIYQDVDFVCMPSYREGIPQSLMEAASCGLPIITTDVPGCRSIIEDGKNGYLVEACSAQALAFPLVEMMQNRHLRLKLGQESRRIALAEFCRNRLTSRYLDLYDSSSKSLAKSANKAA